MIIAAALCPAPPLLAPELTGAATVAPELRQACAEAAADLARELPDAIAVVAAARETRIWDGGSRLDLAIFAPALPASPGTPGLPPALGLGALLLDQAGYRGPRILQAVGQDEPAARCAELGAELARRGERLGLLVMADGSARRGPRAPGHLDERSAAFDAEVERAFREADLDTLMAVDPGLATDLMAAGRAPWQVLSGALHGARPAIKVSYADDPFGVAYLVASITLPNGARNAGE